jgi:hypothetical protein
LTPKMLEMSRSDMLMVVRYELDVGMNQA